MDGMTEIGRLANLSAPRRNNYFYGKLMDVPHFQMEQRYLVQERWLLNRLSLGQGVLCGLTVAPNAAGTQVCVSPGVAIDALGREVVVPVSTCVDPWQLTDVCGQPASALDKSTEHTVYLCLAYRECRADFMPVLVTDCNTHEQCSPGTIVETFCLLVQQVVPPPQPSPEPPPLADPTTAECEALSKGINAADRRKRLCTVLSNACPTPTGDICIPLATVDLTATGTIGSIDDFTFRPRVYSNAVLLDLILCLAGRVEQISCSTAFPSGFVPFDQIMSTSGPDPASGDSVVVGRISGANYQTVLNLPQQQSLNQVYCGAVQLGPASSFIAYVPTPAERSGDFSNFGPQLIDPSTGNPFPNKNKIPQAELPVPGGTAGVFAWRIRSKVT